MKIKFLHIALWIAMLCVTQSLTAQKQRTTIQGTIVESKSQQPVEFATVMLASKTTQKAITATTTDTKGMFSLQTDSSDFYVEISFIGFENKKITDFKVVNGKVNLGTISLSDKSQDLGEVIVRADKSQTEFKLDKRVFNVGSDLSSSGGSALDVLNNVPSVNINIEGGITLRGSGGVQVLINGKPSVLASEEGNALGTITAEMIEKVEVITNPSAKYDAEGTSGIINIILKKEEKRGINGSFSLNTGIPHNHSLGFSLNRRTEKFNLFSQLGVGYRELPHEVENINRNLGDSATAVLSEGREYRNELFYNVILGTDYHIDANNVITLSGYFAYEIEDQPSATNFRTYDMTGQLENEWNRSETTEATNPKYSYELQYKRDFKDDKNHDLLFSALGNFFGKKQASEFESTPVFGTTDFGNQQTETEFKEAKYTFKLDYTRPFSKQWTLETGAQYLLNDVSNNYAVTDFTNGEWIANPNYTNLFEYDQKVLGVYGTGAYEADKWGLKLGLRMENTALNTLLTNTNKSNKQNFTNYFPSVHTSYKVNEKVSLQAGYSRRIYRPRLWDLNPFFNIRNNFSIRTGNPELQPEFTDSYELNSIYILDKISFNLSVYHRYTTEKIERVSTFENNVRTFMPMNIGTSRSTGVELNAKYSPSKRITFNGEANYRYFQRKGTFDALVFDFNGDRWSTELTAKLKLPYKIDMELAGEYNSKYKTVQGVTSGNLFANLGVRKKILKGKGVLNFSVRDIFASRIRESEVFQADFYTYSRRQRGRFITLGFSYGFGKGEAMEFSGQRRR